MPGPFVPPLPPEPQEPGLAARCLELDRFSVELQEQVTELRLRLFGTVHNEPTETQGIRADSIQDLVAETCQRLASLCGSLRAINRRLS